ncbi:SH2 domain-containing protein 2A, partial [Egretta garzetta]|uniref:SH2 domain-containing protein 2A n=1 Tax=Egretta garzetta TaxID=188379 RepID=UPI00163D1E45
MAPGCSAPVNREDCKQETWLTDKNILRGLPEGKRSGGCEGDPTDDRRPLFSTFKPIGEGNTAGAKLGPNTTPVQPPRAEQPLGHHNTDGRVPPGSPLSPRGWSPLEGDPRPELVALGGPPGSPLSPRGWPPLEGDPRPELVALRARTRLWFEQTQARRLGAEGKLPAWFHGFISRRETEQLLQDQPQGCFLVRFSESTVGFVLSYRGGDRCRHFVLDELPDGRYVILGERSAHAELADLLRHYTAAPVTPYHDPPVARGPHSPAGGAAAPKGPYAQVHKEATRPELPAPPQPADAKYQQLLCFHTYAEPREGIAPRPSIYYELEEPIPFYAMGRGSSPSADPEENLYSEVALARQDLPAPLSVGTRGAFATLPP